MATQKQKRVRHHIRVIDHLKTRNPIAWLYMSGRFLRAQHATRLMERTAQIPTPNTRLIH